MIQKIYKLIKTGISKFRVQSYEQTKALRNAKTFQKRVYLNLRKIKELLKRQKVKYLDKYFNLRKFHLVLALKRKNQYLVREKIANQSIFVRDK